MDDMNAFERQLAAKVVRMAGPDPHVNALEIARSAATQSPKWRFQTMFNATRFVVAGAIVALFGGFVLSGVVTDAPSREPAAGVRASASSPPPRTFPASAGLYLSGRRSLTVAGVPLTFALPAGSTDPWPWESLKDDLYISKSTVGPQAAEAMILWTSFPDGEHARPCLLDPSAAGASAAALAEAVATAPGTELVSGPTDVSVGGRPAKSVVVTVVPATGSGSLPGPGGPLGCDPAYFFGWDAVDGGAFWLSTIPGDTLSVWVVEVDGTLLVIEAGTHPKASAAVQGEIPQIIDSIRFE
jgi:hypothetical protein